MLDYLKNVEPVLLLGAVNAVILLAVGFGLPVTPAQVALISAAVTAILSLIQRKLVSSPATVKAIEAERDDLKNALDNLQEKLVVAPRDGAA